MKFLSFIWKFFDFSARHWRGAARLEKGKVSTRIFIMLGVFLGAAATIAVEYWAVSLFKGGDNLLYSICIAVLAVILGAATTEFGLVYSWFGFTSAIVGSLSKAIEKARMKKRKAAESADSPIENAEAPVKKAPRWLDALMGIVCGLLTIGIYAAVVLFIMYLAG